MFDVRHSMCDIRLDAAFGFAKSFFCSNLEFRTSNLENGGPRWT